MSKLYVVATPIGNLRDITSRALEVLKSVDVILAEDTRVTKKLLSRFDIHKPVFSFHRHSSRGTHEKVLEMLHENKSIALVTDAGTPGVSDPGQHLVKTLVEEGFGGSIVAIPGASSLAATISMSDIDCSEFLFLGFPPHKKGRKTFFERVAKSEAPVILFESPHRIQKTLSQLLAAAGDRYVNIGRELTKVHEEVFRGKLSEAGAYFAGEKQRGEFTLIVTGVQ